MYKISFPRIYFYSIFTRISPTFFDFPVARFAHFLIILNVHFFDFCEKMDFFGGDIHRYFYSPISTFMLLHQLCFVQSSKLGRSKCNLGENLSLTFHVVLQLKQKNRRCSRVFVCLLGLSLYKKCVFLCVFIRLRSQASGLKSNNNFTSLSFSSILYLKLVVTVFLY